MIAVSKEGNTIRVAREDGIFYIPINEERRLRFEKTHGARSLFKLYSLFAEDCKSFTEIGKIIGLTKQRISQIYKQDIMPFLPFKSGRERVRQCTLASVHLDRFPKATLAVWREGRKNGVVVSHLNSINSNSNVYTLRTGLILNGKRCRIASISNQLSPPGCQRKYARLLVTSKSLRKFDFLICVLYITKSKKQFFIIPTADLLSGPYIKSAIKCFYLPYEILPVFNNIIPKLVWSSYINAWHLIK
ncbi:MAG: hypothetical protein Q8L47_00670 [bacterium]|nr:hypothetical protein [bacterium]